MIRSSAINHGFVLGYKDAKSGYTHVNRDTTPQTAFLNTRIG